MSGFDYAQLASDLTDVRALTFQHFLLWHLCFVEI